MIIANVPVTPPTYACLMAESVRQQLPPELLLAIMRTEGGKLGQFTRNKNGTYDVGPMQINTSWVPKISRNTHTAMNNVTSALAFHGCWNLSVGAWILRSAINESNGDVWKGVGRYNSPNSRWGIPYARRVQQNLRNIVGAMRGTSISVQPESPRPNYVAPGNSQVLAQSLPGNLSQTTAPSPWRSTYETTMHFETKMRFSGRSHG